jgi:hypothetical protein
MLPVPNYLLIFYLPFNSIFDKVTRIYSNEFYFDIKSIIDEYFILLYSKTKATQINLIATEKTRVF